MSQVGTVYAQALYSLTKDEACSEAVLKELSVLSHIPSVLDLLDLAS